MLHDAISFYENLITNLEKYFDFNFRFYATEGYFFSGQSRTSNERVPFETQLKKAIFA